MGVIQPGMCPLCNAEAKSLWPEVKVCRCLSCSLLFRDPVPSPEQLEDLYTTSWSDPGIQVNETGATDLHLARVYAHQLARSLRKNDLKGLRILDYGAGRGAMTKVLVDAGADVCCVDPYGYPYLQQSGYKAFPSLQDLPQGIVFDGIISLDVAEHLPVPWDDYRTLNQRLSENGWLYLSTPNAAGIRAQSAQGKWRELHNRGHLFFFTPSTLQRLLVKSGYNNIRRLRWYINYHKGPMRVFSHWLLQLLWIDGELRYLAFK